jgi:hypothetical protein
MVPATAAADELHQQIELAASGSSMTLELVHGQTVTGTFRGFVGDWRDTVAASVRYEAWLGAQPEGIPRLGEPLTIVLAAGDTLRGAFEGVGPSYLVLSSGNSRYDLPAYYANVVSVSSDRGEFLRPWQEMASRLTDAPSVIGVGLQVGGRNVVVLRETIVSVSGDGHKASMGPGMGTFVVAGVLVGVLVCAAVSSSRSGGGNSGNSLQLDDLFQCCTNVMQSSRTTPDARLDNGDLSHGLKPRPAGETRRP